MAVISADVGMSQAGADGNGPCLVSRVNPNEEAGNNSQGVSENHSKFSTYNTLGRLLDSHGHFSQSEKNSCHSKSIMRSSIQTLM